MSRAALVAWLTLLWLLLWRDVSVANTVSGLLVAGLVVTMLPLVAPSRGEHSVRPLRLLVFLAYFAWRLVVSSFVVARAVVSRRDRVRSGIVAVPVLGCSDLVTTVVADVITLTPGTMTLEVTRDPPTLYVHVMHLREVEHVRRDIHRLQWRVLQAIGSQAAIGHLAAVAPAATGSRSPEALPEEHSR